MSKHVPLCTLLPMNHDLGSSENSSTSQISVPFLLSKYLFAEPADKTRITIEYAVGISTSQNLESEAYTCLQCNLFTVKDKGILGRFLS